MPREAGQSWANLVEMAKKSLLHNPRLRQVAGTSTQHVVGLIVSRKLLHGNSTRRFDANMGIEVDGTRKAPLSSIRGPL